MLEMFKELIMARSKTKVVLHISLFDWRISMGIGFLLGIVVTTAPEFVGLILLLGFVSLALLLVSKERI
jgi:hypothetical protein